MNELTREQILSMDERQLAEATAVHVMKWKTIDKPNTGEWVYMQSFDEQGRIDKYLEVDLWNPAVDIAHAWEVETEIDNIGALRAEYVTALKSVLASTGEYVGFFDYIHATPKQRSQAALLAVMGL